MAPEDFFGFVPEIGMCRGGLAVLECSSYCFSCLGIQLLGLGIRMCNGGQAKQLTSLESWILGEGRLAMGNSFPPDIYSFSE